MVCLPGGVGQRPFDTPQSVTLRHGGAAIKKHNKMDDAVRPRGC
jgi:hypothetical protein